MKYLKLFLLPALITMASGITLAQENTTPDSPVAQEIHNENIKSLYFNNALMSEACDILSEAIRIPVIVSQNAGAKKITISLKNVKARLALDAICRAYGLWYKLDEPSGIIYIQTLEEFKNTIQLMGNDTVEIVQILYPNVVDIGEALKQLYVNKVVWSRPDISSGDRFDQIQMALQRMDLLSDRGLFSLNAESMKSTVGDAVTGNRNRYTNSTDRFGTNNRFSDYNHYDNDLKTTATDEAARELQKITRERLEEMIRKIGEKAAATYADITSNPGVVYISAIPESNSLLLRSADPTAIKQIQKIITDLDKPSPQVLLEVKILSVRLDDTNQHALDFLFKSGDVSGGFANGIPSSTSSSGNTILPPNQNFVPQGTGTDNRAAAFSAITKNFAARFQFLQTDDRMTRLATPNLLVSDNEASKIFIGDEITIMEKAEQYAVMNSNNGGTNSGYGWQIEAPRRQIGTALLITPKIHGDRSVTIRIMQEHSQLGQLRQNVYQGTGSDTMVANQYFISQDINLQTLTTTIISRDQNLVVIGGLITEGVEKYLEKVPWISEIPYLGELLFSRMKESRTRNEILVIIRPFVLLAPGESDAVSRSFMQRISQHPSAIGDIPSLSVNYPEEVAKPRSVNPTDPWVIRAYDNIRTWSVDDQTGPDIERAAYEYNLIKGKAAGEKTIDKINNFQEDATDE